MRVVHLADYAAPYAGAFIPMIHAAAEAARGRGWDFELALPAEAEGRPWAADLPRHGLAPRLVPPGGRRALARWIAASLDDRPTILHTHFATYDVPATAAARGRGHVKVVWHVHNTLKTAPAVRARNTLTFGLLGRRVAAFVCVAPDAARDVRARLAPRGRVHVLLNGIPTDRFPLVGAEQRRAARERLGLDPADAALLHYGWDWHRKGGDVFVDAVRRLRAAGRRVLGLTVGGDPAAAGDGVRVLAPVDDVRLLHAAADCFVSPSRAEGMPFSIVEALASGLPAVASDVPEGQVAIGRDLPGYRLTPLDAGAVADAVAGLLDRDPEQAAADARATRELVVARWDIRPWAERLMKLYEEVA
ncbi:MAG TPA: glycosyltransferase [Solirubrobacteraceae bacterium]|nr:glycosyltransferase [Solirubrobacteraceae bacterium]